MLKIRKASLADLTEIMNIYKNAQDFMIASGNPNQWGHSYPDESLIRKDIAGSVCHVLYDDSGIHGVFALFTGIEPTYLNIEDGEWLNDDSYLTIHRIAGDGLVHGIFQCAADYCKGLSDNVRIDTHHCNRTMQRLIAENGFQKCGTIFVRDGSPRIAYQWCRGSAGITG